jgi:hypothetical protein
MKFELNREYPEPGEDKLIEKMVKLAVELMKPQQGRIRRVPKNSGSMLHRFSVRSYDPRNVWFAIFGYVTATLATCSPEGFVVKPEILFWTRVKFHQ